MTEMEKGYKIAMAKLPAWKNSTQNKCKQFSKFCKMEQKGQKISQKMQQKNLENTWKKQKLAQLWKISTRGAAAAATFFHLYKMTALIMHTKLKTSIKTVAER